MSGKALVGAVIGCGNIARFHFPGLEKAGVKIKWVCDVKEEARRSWAARYGAKESADYMDAIRDPEVGLVNVCASSFLHKEVCLAAIEAGKAVICEKTLSLNPADSWEIVSAAERKGTPFYTIYMKRFIPAMEKAKELLPSLGPLISGSIRAFQPWGNDYWSDPGKEAVKRSVPASAGGGILICGGSHILDLVCNFFGRPSRIYGTVRRPAWMGAFDVGAHAFIETDLCPVHYDAVAHPLKRIGFHGDGWDESLEITGAKGRITVYSAKWDQTDSLPSLVQHYDDASGSMTEYRYPAISPHVRAIESFCESIASGRQGERQSRVTGYDVDELIACLETSNAERRAVDILWKG